MKKYKTSEAIAMLEQNPKLRFKTEGSKYYDMEMSVGAEFGRLVIKSIPQNYNVSLSENIDLTKDIWILIQQAVPFMEAVKAYAEGKTIRCEYESERSQIYKPKYRFVEILDENGSGISAKEILDCKWFIEND